MFGMSSLNSPRELKYKSLVLNACSKGKQNSECESSLKTSNAKKKKKKNEEGNLGNTIDKAKEHFQRKKERIK